MNRTLILTPAVIALAISLAAPPAFAQARGRDRPARDRSAQSSGASRQRPAADRPAPSRGEATRRSEPRGNAARDNTPSSAPRGYASSRNTPRAAEPARGESSSATSAPRGYASSRAVPRGAASAAPAAGPRGYTASPSAPPPAAQRYDNRAYDNRAYDSRAYNSGRAYDSGYGRWDSRPRGSYNRDAWRGRIHLGLGFSIFAGSPFTFRFDYGWRPSFSYYYTMRPGIAYGGMSFLLYPDYAEVYIDGQFVGIARDFGGQPVPVAAGYHLIEIYAPGFEPVAFDIQVFPGQVIPYRGSLYPVY